MRLVIKIGGSLCMKEDGPDLAYISRLVPILEKISQNNQLIVCVGGGQFVSNYFRAARKIGLGKEEMEWIAVELLRANARLFASILNKKPVFSLSEIKAKSNGVVSGGIKPGRSSDANAAYAAAAIKADYFIKLTNVDGIYDKDPKKFRSAKKMNKIPFSQLKKYSVRGSPKNYGILDSIAIGIISKNKIKTVVASGKNPQNLLRILRGEKIGTLIS